jgi:uncharacterized hydrophobic protein (TIGR00271 family)
MTVNAPAWPRRLPQDQCDAITDRLASMGELDSAFLLQTVLACLIATFGLHLNSTAVIIGAMIVAPLMAPLMAIAGALAIGRPSLLREGLVTLVIGTGVSLAVSAGVSLLITVPDLTSEILARTQPTLLDLGVALAAGAVGAYAHLRRDVKGALPGVAIAVALMPPLCSVGITLVAGRPALATGALMLFVTNLAGIIVAATLTLMIGGYAGRLPTNWRDLGRWVAVMLVLIWPLSHSLAEVLDDRRISRTVRDALRHHSLLVQTMDVVAVTVDHRSRPMTVTVVARSPDQLPSGYQVGLLEAMVRRETAIDLQLHVQVMPVVLVTPRPDRMVAPVPEMPAVGGADAP